MIYEVNANKVGDGRTVKTKMEMREMARKRIARGIPS
jgi:hypothetical protein